MLVLVKRLPCQRHRDLSTHLVLLIIRLLEQEVRRQFLVLVAREVSLHDLISREPQTAQPFDGIALLLRDADGHCAGGHWSGLAHSADGVASDVLREMSV
jgi:hypothetical protein